MKFIRLTILTLLSVGVSAADKIPADQLEFFETKIRPVLAESCYECHNSVDKKKGKLALDWREPMLKGGSEGLAVVPGKPEQSLLIKSIRHEDDLEMPSKAPKLSDEVIADFVKWIKMGAPDPRNSKPTKEDLEKSVKWEDVRNKRSEWWSFQPLKFTLPVKPEAKEWQKNQIDAFIYAKLKKHKLKPSEKADKYTLIRRAHLILTGLPPKQEDLQRFLSSKDPQAYEKEVDRLLKSDAFGEKWARHWMDWYRYANTHGSEGDPQIPYSESYRDYLIRALNQDIPYNQLLKEHIAGDLLKEPRINTQLGLNESAIGPAHFRFVPHGFGVTDAYDEQITFTDNQIDVLSKAMLGVTVSCARCHNHKFDPISQKDFYRLYGIMLSNKPSSIVVDTKEIQDKNKVEIKALKNQIRDEFAKFWLSELKHFPERMNKAGVFQAKLKGLPKIPKGKKLSKKEKDQRNREAQRIRSINDKKQRVRELSHPFNLWTLLKQPKNQLGDYKKNYEGFIKQTRMINEEAIKTADYYVDFTKKDSPFYTSGNGIEGPSPAGSFALNAKGENAITSIYPSGIYSHLISSKHAAVFSSGNFKIVKDSKFSILMAGADAQSRLPIRNYPLTHGGLHPAKMLRHDKMKWEPGPGRWHYWTDDIAHFELRTGKDMFPRPGAERSWFGVKAIHIGKKTPRSEGANILELLEKPENLKDKSQIEDAYIDVLSSTIKKWQEGKVSDKEAVFLNSFLENGVLSNKIKNFPDSLKSKISAYRKLESEIPSPTRAPGLMEAEIIDQPLLVRGDYKKESEPVNRAFLEVFGIKNYSAKDSGRLELAEDIVSQKNTLKTRVLINRLWSYVFGHGIVKSTDNFGRLGSKPSHPDLLDYLSDNFEKNGWSIKSTLRDMLTSRTFMSSSQNSAKADELDPTNTYFSYFSPRRMEAEMIFDSLNAISGRKYQRAIYDKVVRNRLNPFLTAFNRPVPVTTISTRLTTNVPAQALTMMNSFTTQLAGHTFNTVLKQKTLKTDEDKIKALFMHAYCRPANKLEIEQCLEFLKRNNYNWYNLIDVILNSKEVIYVY